MSNRVRKARRSEVRGTIKRWLAVILSNAGKLGDLERGVLDAFVRQHPEFYQLAISEDPNSDFGGRMSNVVGRT